MYRVGRIIAEIREEQERYESMDSFRLIDSAGRAFLYDGWIS